MKIIVAADIHGDYDRWREVISYLEKGDLLVVAGDILGDRYPDHQLNYQPQDITRELLHLPHDKQIVAGNCDLTDSRLDLQHTEVFTALNKRFFLGHGHLPSHSIDHSDIDIQILGHSHVYQLEQENNYIRLNPGSPTKPRTDFRSIAIIKPANGQLSIQIIDLDSKDIIQSLQI